MQKKNRPYIGRASEKQQVISFRCLICLGGFIPFPDLSSSSGSLAQRIRAGAFQVN
jgi:hypothetical protein